MDDRNSTCSSYNRKSLQGPQPYKLQPKWTFGPQCIPFSHDALMRKNVNFKGKFDALGTFGCKGKYTQATSLNFSMLISSINDMT